MGPIYLLEAIILVASGTSFFRDMGVGDDWFTQFSNSFDEGAYPEDIGLGASFGAVIIGLASVVLFPVAEAAILIAINHIRKGEEYSIGSVIKKGFKKFWSMLGSNILFGLITFGVIFIPIMIVTFIGVFSVMANPFLGVIFALFFGLLFFVGIGYLMTRWSFYFGSVVLDDEAPGFTRSWRLTKGRAWVSFGLYIIFFLIISCISFAVELSFGIFLGNSVLLTLIVNIVTIFTTLIFAVGYAVMYLDLKIRHDAEDLDEMIDDYRTRY